MSEPNTPLIFALLSSLGISAAVGGLASAVINYFMNQKEFRRKIQTSFIEKRLDTYSFMIYQLNQMRYRNNALTYHELDIKEEGYAFTTQEWNEAVKSIDLKIQDKYYLLSSKILELWVWTKTLIPYPIALEKVAQLRGKLIQDYNAIVVEHRKILGVGVTPMPEDSLSVSAKIEKKIVSPGDTQRIVVNAVDSKSEKVVENAKVKIEIFFQNGKRVTVDAITDDKGQESYLWQIDSNMTIGESKVIITVDAHGYDSKMIMEKFSIESRRCSPL